jgi:methionyl aminopeptidase
MTPATTSLELRSSREIAQMRRAGLVVWQAHQVAAQLVRPGITTRDIDQAIAQTFRQTGAEPLFLGYQGASRTPFPAVTCISINEQVVHGIPGDRKLEEGSIVSLDTGCRLAGWCGDAAITHAVGAIPDRARRLLDVTRQVLDLAIELMSIKRTWDEVATEMEAYVHRFGMSVVEGMVGHGIGRAMHEPPNVPNYHDARWARRHDFELRPGLVLAIEPMVNLGSNKLRVLRDDWTVVTQDAQWSAHFEHTVALTADGPTRLTGPPTEDELHLIPERLRDETTWVRW